MKYLCILFVAIVAMCSPIIDRRSGTERKATQTSRASEPQSGMGGVLFIRVLTPPPVTVEPQVAPTKGAP